MGYRREIDGLRALAIVPVIFFHAGFQAFSGGFVGVDVFFVISGYLITTIILAEKEAGTFTILNFYERRARRILPALFFVMFACLPLAWFWLPPADMKSFSQSLVAVSVFSSNILFWRTSGYFAQAAELKPLLHTWSLAVEEQYYIFFPIFLMITWKLGRRWIVALLASVTLICLAASQWGSSIYPEATFFLLPTRCWELLIGTFVAFYFSRQNKTEHSHAISQLFSFIGLTLIIYAVFAFDKNIPFPSLYALTPTVGAALIVLFATPRTLVGKLLGSKLFVGIGLISYSSYLWHQPLFAFVRHRNLDEPNNMLIAAIATVVLAYLSWKFVETPFRNKQCFNRKQIFFYATLGSALFLVFGLIGHQNKGYPNRLNADQREFLAHFENSIPEWNYFTREKILEKYRDGCDFYDVQKYRSGNPTKKPVAEISESCFIRNRNYKNAVLIWGDSHAQQLYPGLNQAMPKSWQILQVTSSGCKAKLNATKSTIDYCEYSNWFAYKIIRDIKPEVVIIGQNLEHNVDYMHKLAEDLENVGVKQVIFTGPTPHWKRDLPEIIINNLWGKIPRRTFVGVDMDIVKSDKEIKSSFTGSSTAKYVSAMDYFCNDDGCLLYIGDDIKEGITSWDYGHLTPIASSAFARDVLVQSILLSTGQKS